MAPFIARWSQALILEDVHMPADTWAPGRMQLYVDDPTIVAWGTRRQRAVSFSMLVLWWLVLGVPLSWTKGSVHLGTSPYIWIGVLFSVPSPGVARMALPPKFVAELLTLCRKFLKSKLLPLASADSLVGKAGRVAYVLPHVRPFIASLYAALAASLRAADARAKESPPGSVVCRRYLNGAGWLIRILGFSDRGAPVPASRDILATRPPAPCPRRRRIEVDASPWGGGAVLFEDDVPTRCFSCTWDPAELAGRDVEVGQPASQTYFEILAALLALELWCGSTTPTAILGDNTAALQELLDLKGSAAHGDLAQALAILRCSRSLELTVGHLPSESNVLADALSRLAAPGSPAAWPFGPDVNVIVDSALQPSDLWAWLS